MTSLAMNNINNLIHDHVALQRHDRYTPRVNYVALQVRAQPEFANVSKFELSTPRISQCTVQLVS